jgi:Carboxypeptidase regulatory-like domain
MKTKRMQVFLILMAACLPMPVPAQTLGAITGVVTDASGASVPNAAVTVTNPQTNFTRATTTNRDGNYDFPALQPGTYNVEANVEGFQVEVRTGLELQVAQVARVDFKLSVGAVTRSVEVTGGAQLINTENASVGTVIENQRIVELPLSGHNYLQLSALSPNVASNFNIQGGTSAGAVTTRLGGERSTQAIAIAGTEREFIYHSLDGVNNTEPNFNILYFPAVD